MKFDLTLRKLSNTDFASLYDRFIVGEELSSKENECLLAIAICFTNATDVLVQQLGYRIIVEFCNQKNNYTPLYEISINKGLYPVSSFIERHCISEEQRNFFTEWNNAFLSQYADEKIYQSEQQHELVGFFNSKEAETVSVIAPTSYGKSELILSAVKEYDAFKNLVGRICRFSEIFDDESGSLHRLEPHIYIVFGQYFAQGANCQRFLQSVARVETRHMDEVKNVLLNETEIDSSNSEDLRRASEFIENYETGIIENYHERYTQTAIGKACIMNGISEIDIFINEYDMQAKVEKYTEENLKINDPNQLLSFIYELFIRHLPEGDNESLKRLEHPEARKFYAMLFGWRAENKSYSEMIGLFVGYWWRLFQMNRDCIIYVGKWGDICRPGGNVPHYTRLRDKNRTRIINLAIVRIKEEQDFIDNVLIKYVEVLHDLGFLEDAFYSKIKYGTDNETTICLLKNGLSLSSATLLLRKYQSHLAIDIHESTVCFDSTLIDDMRQNRENDILICEVQSCM